MAGPAFIPQLLCEDDLEIDVGFWFMCGRPAPHDGHHRYTAEASERLPAYQVLWDQAPAVVAGTVQAPPPPRFETLPNPAANPEDRR